MKKTLSLITAIVMVVSLIASFGCVNADAATTNVSLYSSVINFSKYGSTQRTVYVKTTGNASNEAVNIAYACSSSYDWRTASAEYYKTLEDGSKIWKAEISSFCTKYAIEYVADGNTYWDNNNGQNYTDEVIGDTNVFANSSFCYYTSSATTKSSIGATVKNLAYVKNVAVRYTTDNWNTYNDAPMSYYETNQDGTENWKTDLILDNVGEGFEYAIYYTVNGQTYWANNFGENFDGTFYVHG